MGRLIPSLPREQVVGKPGNEAGSSVGSSTRHRLMSDIVSLCGAGHNASIVGRQHNMCGDWYGWAILTACPSHGKWPIRTGIGRTQPALDGRCTCTVCVPFQSVCIPFQSVLGTHRSYVPVGKVFPIRTEMVRKQTNGTQTVQVQRPTRAGWVRPMPVRTGHFPCASHTVGDMRVGLPARLQYNKQ